MMKKKLLGAALAAALVLTQAVSVFAAGSRTNDVALSGSSAGSYEVSEGSAEAFSDVAAQSQTTVDTILAINSGSSDIQDLGSTLRTQVANGEIAMTEEEVAALEQELSDKDMVTGFFDLDPIEGGTPNADGSHTVTMGVPSLSDSMTDVKVLHYSTERTVWEVITPDEVDYTDKEITATFQDLSPVAIIAKVNASSTDTSVGTSPQTGVASTWMVWAGAAVILAGAAYVLNKKTQK